MKKLFLLGCFGLLAGCMLASTGELSLREMKQLIKEGKALKPSVTLPSHEQNGINMLPTAKSSFPSKMKNPFSSFDKRSVSKKSPLRLTEKGAELYGYLTYDRAEGMSAGMYEFNETGYTLLWEDPLYPAVYTQAMRGWLLDGKYSGVQLNTFSGYIFGYYGFSIDFETGELLEVENYNVDDTPVLFLNYGLNTEDNKVYGLAYNFNDKGNIYWASGEPDDIANATAIQYMDILCYAITYNPSDGYYYGITTDQEFVKIGLDGSYTIICVLPESDKLATFVTGMVWSPVVKAFYWNCYYNDDTSGLATLTVNGDFQLLETYPSGPEFTTFLTTDEGEIDPNKPGRVKIDSIDFKDGSLKGNVNFIMPDELANGNLFESSTILEYYALLDDVVYKTGNAVSGSEVTVEYSVGEKGYHKFGIYVVYKGIESSVNTLRTWIGNDTPFAPESVKLSSDEITWTPVGSEGIHGGYVNVSDIEYDVYLNDEYIGTTSQNKLNISLPEDEPISLYRAVVYARFDGELSEGTSSNGFIAGQPYEVPVFIQPTEEEFELMVIEDTNKDGFTWAYTSEYNGAVETKYTINDEDYFDDYIFLPPVSLTDTEYYYRFSFDAAIKHRQYSQEYMEVVYASAPTSDAIMGVLINEFTPNATREDAEWDVKEVNWKISSPGTYYIGIHAMSAGDQLGLLAKAFNLTRSSITDESPVAPEIISIIPAVKGELKATVNFKFPALRLNGEDISAGETMTATIYVNGISTDTSVTGHAGEEVAVSVPTLQGDNTIRMFVTLGSIESPAIRGEVYTGQTVPATPQNLKVEVSRDMMSVYLSWDAVTEPYDADGYIVPSEVTYVVSQYLDWGIFGGSWVTLAEGITDTNCTIRLDEGTEQEEYRFGVFSYNIAGSNKIANYDDFIAGTPYPLPFVDNFDDPYEVLSTNPWLVYSQLNGVNYAGSWVADSMYKVTDAFGDDDQAVIAGYTTKDNSMALIGLPRFSTFGVDKATFYLGVVTGPETANGTILAQIYGLDDLIEIGKIQGNAGYQSAIEIIPFELPEEVLNQYWVQIYIQAEFESADDMFIITSVEASSDGMTLVEWTGDLGNVTTAKNAIIVNGFEGSYITINTLDGKVIVDEFTPSNQAIYNVEKGIYIVNLGNKKVKVLVK